MFEKGGAIAGSLCAKRHQGKLKRELRLEAAKELEGCLVHLEKSGIALGDGHVRPTEGWANGNFAEEFTRTEKSDGNLLRRRAREMYRDETFRDHEQRSAMLSRDLVIDDDVARAEIPELQELCDGRGVTRVRSDRRDSLPKPVLVGPGGTESPDGVPCCLKRSRHGT